MIRVTTLFARTAGATAAYYGGYLTKNSHELPGQWTGKQAPDLGLIGEVTPECLEAVLLGRHPFTGESLGRELLDRIDQKGERDQGGRRLRRDVLGTEVGVGAVGTHWRRRLR
jgi:TrwC relaxase